MRRLQQIGSLAFLAFALFMVVEARKLTYFTYVGPGPGFFPFWIGCLLAVLAASQLVQASLAPAEPLDSGFVPSRAGVLRMLSIVAAVALFGFLVNTLGFQLLMFAFLVFLLMALGRQSLILTAVVSLAGSFGQYYLFKHWLDVDLPVSSIELLRNLGL